MSTIKVTNLRHESASSSNITLDSSNNVTTANNFTAGGTIGCTGDLTVTSGNLVVSSGNGIDFSATGGPTNGTGSSELFDDYEEGTWTPTFSGSSSGSFSVAADTARYTKIGRIVHCHVGFQNKSFGAFSGDLRMSLPFTAVSNGGFSMPGTKTYMYPNSKWDGYASFAGYFVQANSNAAYATFQGETVDADGPVLSSSNSSLSSATGLYLRLSLTYEAQ